ncbi:unnamed protein product [Urochloa humidicola]
MEVAGLFMICLHSFLLLLLPVHGAGETLLTYIVQLHPHEGGAEAVSAAASRLDWHGSFLERSVAREQEKRPASRLLYSYHTVFDGFAAQLTGAEAAALRALPGVASVRADRRLELHTTYSYRFLGLNFCPTGAWARSGYGRGAIVGVLDTGVWPESPSFDDRGMPPAPLRWTGTCQGGEQFNASNCNRKLIGARFYSKGHRANYPTNPSESASLL